MTRLSVFCLVAMATVCLSLPRAHADSQASSGAATASPAAEATQLVAAPAEVPAEDTVVEEHANTPPLLSFDIGSAVCNVAIFLGVLAILSKFVWPPILSGLKAREDKINGDLENAERINAEARSLLSEYQLKLDEAATQVQGMLAEARRDAEVNGQRIVADAKAEAERTRDRAIVDIETA
ncbi:MAG: ATP synthase F0 subunit B, partial [Novipirellula sp. JB048]